jgi:isopenicillin N synthase-like dioxygenase
MMLLPTINLNTASIQSTADEIKLLRESCESAGFFYLQVQDDDLVELLPRVFNLSKQFFALTTDTKRNFSDHVLNRGFTGMQEETLDPEHQTKGDTKEGYYLAEDIPDTDPRYNPNKLAGPNMYPKDLPVQDLDCDLWRKTMMEYHGKMKQISFQLIQMLALALDLSQIYFDEHFQEPLAVLRLLHYSNKVSDIDRGIFACGAHSDYGMVTLLATDDQPGLQIYHEGNWVDIPPPGFHKGKFVVNLGDMLERWTNGRFKSTLHRVVRAESEDRYSIPFFYEPNFDTNVECLEKLHWGRGCEILSNNIW